MTSSSVETLAVYIHWPFCASKCPYCDFNSHVSDAIDHDAWTQSYLKEIDHYASLTPGRRVTSIFFGGGTPSLMKPETVAAIIDHVQKRWTISNDIEITLEANPTSIEAGKFKAFRDAGINRVSVGVQALNDDDLKFLGRAHDSSAARRAIDIAANTFSRYSFDLIYARPNQTVESWRAELSDALTMAGSHLSLYQLTIEKGTPFFTWHERGDFSVPENDIAADLYEVTQDVLSGAGLPAYEISNHARAGQESAHNMAYWRYNDYAGIGPGAHGRLTLGGIKYATRAHRAPDIWLSRVNELGHGAHPFETVDADARFSECLMMGLRLLEGISLSTLSTEGGKDWQERMAPAKIKTLENEGLIVLEPDRIRPTPAGMQRLNGILSYLS